MLDRAKKVVPTWQRGLITRPGRLILVKSIMSARPIHHFLVMDTPLWVYGDLNKWMRAFFWTAKDKANGGQCLVAWNNICKPVGYGGLGVKNLQIQALALRVRWEWLRRVYPERPWQGIPLVVDKEARQVFDSLVKIKVGNGTRVLFWRDRWIHGFVASDIAALVVSTVEKRTRNRRAIQQALTGATWPLDVQGELSFTAHIPAISDRG